MSDNPEITQPLHVYYLKKSNGQSIIYTSIEGIIEPVKTLIDSGSSQNFINRDFVRKNEIQILPLGSQRSVVGINGEEIEDKISEKTELNIDVEGKKLTCIFYVMPLGDTEVILGKDWLEEAKPVIRWRDLSITYEDNIVGKAAELEAEIPEEFQDFKDLFQEEGFSKLPEHRIYDCAIDFADRAEVPRPAETYAMSLAESLALKEYLNKELKDSKIRPSKSITAAPCFYVNKADGGLRLVVDYRKINTITKPDQFPMPIQADLVEKLKDAKIFTKLDIQWGFNNIQIKEGDEWKTVFRTKEGIFEYSVVPFGIRNGPAVFQRFVNKIFHNLINVYLV
ncbi:hypothetical protein FRC07_001668, partial [Ceratobasidium sp. 392]